LQSEFGGITLKEFMKTFCIIFLSATFTLFGEDLNPDLARVVTSYRGNSKTLETQHSSAIAASKQAYLTVLVAADKTATKSGNAAALAAITKERECIEKSTIPDEPEKELPKTLLGYRRQFLKANERATAEFAQKKKVVDGDLLRGLSDL
jgi:hypothetical protein